MNLQTITCLPLSSLQVDKFGWVERLIVGAVGHENNDDGGQYRFDWKRDLVSLC